ncbi:MAG TPA: PA2169 family four-helix-bundle protein, partial [Methylophilaceae bacterium]|nr:PA2169 family four-helix-bundle protein [Methylophilaceae bacterium]
MTNEDIINNLNDLIETCKDGEEGFRTCAADIRNVELKQFFIARAVDCAASAEELQQIFIEYDGDPETKSTIAGAMHRRWVDF